MYTKKNWPADYDSLLTSCNLPSLKKRRLFLKLSFLYQLVNILTLVLHACIFSGYAHYIPDCLKVPYPYMNQLTSTAVRTRIPAAPPQLPVELQSITTPLVLSRWCELLQHHPDTAFSSYILEGIREGLGLASSFVVTP